MIERDDHELLAEYARTESETAFATLVGRYVNLVHSAAWRFTGNPHHAEEITQAVFIILARKAGRLRRGTVLSGWLYQTARLTAANFVKGEIRRQHREQEVYMQSTLTEPAPAAWEQIAPLLDEAMGRLGEIERNAVVLRFFENKTAAEVGAALKLTEAAAHMRVSRALEKLHRYFARRGVSSTTAIIAGAISANSVQSAPVALAKTVTAVAVTKGAAVSGSTLTLIKGALKIMAWTKMKTAVVVGVGVLLAAGTTTVTITQTCQPSIDEYFSRPDPNKWPDSPPMSVVQQTHFSPSNPNWDLYGNEDGRTAGKGFLLEKLLRLAYTTNGFLVPPERVVFPTNLPTTRYDFMVTVRDNPKLKLREEVKKQTGYAGRFEIREQESLVLNLANPKLFDAAMQNKDAISDQEHYPKKLKSVCLDLEYQLNKPVVNKTGIPDDTQIPMLKGKSSGERVQYLKSQLGLELVPGREPVEMLVVEKVK